MITIRKVELNMDEQQKYLVIKKLVETNGNKNRAAVTLGCTVRHVYRMIQGYIKEGKEFFVHGNRGKKPAHALDEEKRQKILDLYRTKYYDANITHYAELLKEYENIEVSQVVFVIFYLMSIYYLLRLEKLQKEASSTA